MKFGNRFIMALIFIAFIYPGDILAQKQISQDERMAWWRDARFGMFIHWGPVTLKGTEIGWSRGDLVPVDEYDQLYKQFNPEHFNADKWVSVAKAAGMKYMILTTKHHDGFCLWNTRQTDYNILNTPFKRDVVKELAEACKKQGMPFGAYYSTCDWRNPDFPLTSPGGRIRRNQSDIDAYTGYLKRQVGELLLNYGPLAVLWFDVPQEFDSVRGQSVIDFARTLQPNIIINNRTGAKGDFETPEQYIPPTGLPGVDWESCMTINDQWAYSYTDKNWKSAQTLVRNLVDVASKGGNYLLNIGPDATGIIPDESVNVLKEMGLWLEKNGEAVYGTTASRFNNIAWGRVTQKKTGEVTHLYLQVFDFPKDGKLLVPGLGNKVIQSYPLQNRNMALKVSRKDADYMIDISKVKPTNYVTVIVLEIAGEPLVYKSPEIVAENEIFIENQIFEIKTDIPDGIIYYTTDGSMPTNKSKVAKGTISVNSKSDITVKARVYLNNQPVSPVSMTVFRAEKPLPTITHEFSNVRYAYYKGNWQNLPDFSQLTPVKSGLIKQISLDEKNAPFDYAFLFEACLMVPETNIYQFFITSDDGSKLFIDDVELINNDGIHGAVEKSKSVALAKGLHNISVQYFQQAGGDVLKIDWKPAGKPRVPVDEKVIKN